MELNDAFGLFLRCENEEERLAHIAQFAATSASGVGASALPLWHMLSSFPTKAELVKIATSFGLSKRPDSSWILASRLLKDPDQDVVGNTLNSVTFSCHRSLGHRALRLLDSHERPQRVLYCIARYAEEAIDRRFASLLASFMQSDLSDAFLARSFNALFRLGRIDRLAIKVAMDLVASHIDATNMDRKAAVSAIVYLCFAGDREDIDNLKSVQNKVTIPELRRLLNWGLYELNGFEILEFNGTAAKNFLKRASNLSEPNFTGYGCFEQSHLVEGAKAFLSELEPENYGSASRTILALGNAEIIDLLAAHNQIGLQAIEQRDLGELKLIWKHYLPTNSPAFVSHIRDPKSFEYWNDRDTELINLLLTIEDFVTGPWQEHFVKHLKTNRKRSEDILIAQFLALERSSAEPTPLADAEHHLAHAEVRRKHESELEGLILENLKKLNGSLQSGNREKVTDWPGFQQTITCILGYGMFDRNFADQAMAQASNFGHEYSPLALTLGDSGFSAKSMTLQLEHELAHIERELLQPQMTLNDFVSWVAATGCAILNTGARSKGEAELDKVLIRFDALTTKLQAMIDAIDGSEPDTDIENDQNSDDWGHSIKDRPLARWNAIIQSVLRKELSTEEIGRYEGLLRDAMKVAPHVDKRWVICGLVRIDTDDAIKAILYQALQHVDAEFVSHTIRQLLKSSHRRSQQALIRSVGRNTISDELKLTILDEIPLDNPNELLAELKTLEILRLPHHIDDAIRDAVGRVASLAGALSPSSDTAGSEKRDPRAVSSEVESTIKSLLPESELLSVDVRSALRTAEMILIQSKDWGNEGVDLSPIVNMHCKAVELVLRETFEGMTDAIIRRGELSRKLDILGYARPIPEKMQIFEDYLAQLPIVRSIPYFSKFKLRKMLRAICLYRPGKRFTLDGPKAFALLFLVGSRRECPFGLAQTIPLSFKTDQELFEFIKLVHSLQDSRNRAVHEGLTWEAQDDIDAMRSQAYQIISYCIRFLKEIRKRGTRNLSGPVGMGA